MTMRSCSRRRFLQNSLLIAGSSVLFPRLDSLARAFAQDQQPGDKDTCERKFALALERTLSEKPIGEVMVAIGTSFIGTPYAAYAIEAPGDEHLIINMQGLDCVSFTENSLALSRCIKTGKTTFSDYREQMQLIRYRNGIIDKYPSRLHYFSDWIDNNVSKNVLHNVTKQIGGQPYEKTINYMSTHRSSYRQLSDDAFLATIKQTEQEITRRRHYYIPKARLSSAQEGIQNGDIIAITSAMKGMDIGHTGMAIRIDGVLRFLHAPLVGSSVQITDKPLVEYLKLHKQHTGIMVARPLEPTA